MREATVFPFKDADRRAGRGYGQLVLSRWPLGAAQIHDITHAKREPRRAIEVEIAVPAGAFRLIAAHFGLTFGARKRRSRPAE